MTNMLIDTLSYANRLKEAGMASALAEEQAMVMSEVLHENITPLATSSELQSVAKVLGGEIQAVEIALRGEIKVLEKTLRGEIQAAETALRGEIKAVEIALRGEIQTLDAEIKHMDHNIRQELLLLEQRMVIKLGGMMVLSLGILTTLTKLI